MIHGNISVGQCENPDNSTSILEGDKMTRVYSEYLRFSVYNVYTCEIIYEWFGQNGEMTFLFE